MKWLLVIFVSGQLAGTIELGSEEACTNARQVIEQQIVIPTPGAAVRMTCVPAGIDPHRPRGAP